MQLSFVELHKALENFQWNIGNTPLWPTLKCKMSLMHILRNEKKVAWESDLFNQINWKNDVEVLQIQLKKRAFTSIARLLSFKLAINLL